MTCVAQKRLCSLLLLGGRGGGVYKSDEDARGGVCKSDEDARQKVKIHLVAIRTPNGASDQ